MSIGSPPTVQNLQDEIARLRAELAAERATLATYRGEAVAQKAPGAASIALEKGRVAQAQDQFEVLTAINNQLVNDTDFMTGVLEASSDCIKVLDLEGKLLFMSSGGQRVMEVEDFSSIIGCPWPDFWEGSARSDVEHSIASAVAGRSSQFIGKASTAKGNPRWWEVTVTPILAPGGSPLRILSISRDVTARVDAEAQKDLLAAELQHRVQNLLSVASAIAQQTLRSTNDLNEASIKIANRLSALSSAHRLLSKDSSLAARLAEIVGEAVKAYDAGSYRIALSGEDRPVNRNAAVALTLTFNELCTNATKYGALSNDGGRVFVDWLTDGDLFRLTWREEGGPPVPPPTRTGFGSRVIRSNIESALGGKITTSFEPTGLLQAFDIPLDSLR